MCSTVQSLAVVARRNKCQNVTRCKEKLALVLPKVPPFKPRQFGRCAVVGNSGDLLLSKFGKDIDSHDVVIRNNGAPTRGFSLQVGEKSTFRLLNRGSAKALDKVVELAGDEKEVLIIKTTIHDVMSKLIQEVPIRNPVYLLLGMQFGAAAKGTGLKALQFALSVCETVDMYGFTVDPGYTNWTRYFSESRGGHAPLQARAYYHMMECLGLVTIHSPLREQRGHVVTEVPSRSLLTGAIRSSMSLNNKQWGASIDPFESCSIWATRASKLSEDHTGNLSKAHFAHDCGLAMYPMPTSSGRQMLCISNKVANVEC